MSSDRHSRPAQSPQALRDAQLVAGLTQLPAACWAMQDAPGHAAAVPTPIRQHLDRASRSELRSLLVEVVYRLSTDTAPPHPTHAVPESAKERITPENQAVPPHGTA